MSCSEQKSAALSGIDWMISYVSWKSRDLPSGGNRFSILAELTDAFCFDEFEKRVSSLRNVKNFLGGRIRRDLAHWSPRWVYNCGEGRGILCSRHKGESLSEICNELPEGVSFQARFFAEERKILFTFSHKVFDGVGAEKFVSFLMQGELKDEVPERRIIPDIPAMKQSGRELQNLMKTFPEKKILRLPENCRNGKNEFETLSFSGEKFRSLEKAIEKKYGPFSVSLFLLALILCELEKNVFPPAPSKEYIFIPMSVDQRKSRGEIDDPFFNNWSLMPLLVSRKVLACGVPETLRHLRQLYTQALLKETPRLFSQASEAMKYLPYRLIDLFVRFSPAKTLGTLMFSFLESSHCGKGLIRNLAHYPDMPYGNNLGFFVNTCNDNLNIVISARAWKGNAAFDLFCSKLCRILEEEEI